MLDSFQVLQPTVVPSKSPPFHHIPTMYSSDYEPSQDQERQHNLSISSIQSYPGQNSPTFASSPISILPPELLLRIFLRLRSISDETTFTQNSLAFTQVCQIWRSLALSTSKLWSNIDLCTRPKEYTALCFSRALSGGADISVLATQPSAFTGSVRDAGLSKLAIARNRVQKLKVALYANSMSKFFEDMLSATSADSEVEGEGGTSDSSERMLTLENLTHLDLVVRLFQPTSDDLDLSFLRIPSIQNLTLDGIRLDWGSIIHDVRSHQRHLTLSLTRIHIAPTDLLGLIQSSSKVFLEDVIVPDYLDWEGLRVSPQNLKEITIFSHSKEFVDSLVAVLSLPTTTKVVKRVRNVTHARFNPLGVDAGGWMGGLGGWNAMERLGG